MWQRCLFVMWRGVMTRLCLIGRLLDDAVSRAPPLQSSAPASLTFDPSIDLGVHFSIGLILVSGPYCVSQIPVPQTFQGQRLVQAPRGLLQLGVLGGGQLLWPGGQEVGVWVGLDGSGQRGIMGIGIALGALLHR